MIKNDLFLRALKKESVTRPPVWLMRQAGRYLPQYQVLKKKYDFFTRIQTPELACEITVQPVDIIGVDAAIIFSDILVIPQAMGLEVLMEEGKGPLLPHTIRTEKDVMSLADLTEEKVHYVFDAIKLTKETLNGRVPLIGFAGAPFTILCYMVEGSGSKTFDKAKAFCFTQPEIAHKLLQRITQSTIQYLKGQVSAGADVIQVFDSWSGLLAPADFDQFAKPYLLEIATALHNEVPVILFPKGSNYALETLSQHTSVSAIGIDWCITPKEARRVTANRIPLQGNFDPVKLLLPIPELKKEVRKMIDEFGVQHFIANLGHGILPHIPVDHARAFVDTVKEYKPCAI